MGNCLWTVSRANRPGNRGRLALEKYVFVTIATVIAPIDGAVAASLP